MDSRIAWRPPGENEEGRQAPLHLTASGKRYYAQAMKQIDK